jgi:hypothetical protein
MVSGEVVTVDPSSGAFKEAAFEVCVTPNVPFEICLGGHSDIEVTAARGYLPAVARACY